MNEPASTNPAALAWDAALARLRRLTRALIDSRCDRLPSRARLTLYGARTEEDGVAMTSSRIVFTPSGNAPFAGTLVQLAGSRLVASLANSSGRQTSMALRLQIENASGRVRGTIHRSPA